MATDIEVDDLLDGADESEETFEPSLGQQLSRLGRAGITAEARKRNLATTGSNPDIIARIEAYEASGGVVADPKDLAGAASASAAAPAPSAPAGGAASAPAGPPSPGPRDPFAGKAGSVARVGKQKVGFFEGTNTWRSEWVVGPRTPDDSTHFGLIESTHDAAREAGYRTLGYPHAGTRVGFSTDRNGSRTAVYEVFAREVE